MFDEVAPGVYSVSSRFVDGKNGLVFGSRGALAVDGSNYVDEGQAMAEFIRGQGAEPVRLALTHGHGDHILGAAPLAGGEVFAHESTPSVIREGMPRQAERWSVTVAEAEARTVWPTVTFRGTLRIDLGGKSVRMIHTPGHSCDSASAFVEPDRVLFAGDAVVTGIIPAIGNGNSRDMEASLQALLELDAAVLVSGHGPVLHGGDAVRDWLQWQVGYISGVRERVVEALAQGSDADGARDAAGFEEFVGDRLDAAEHGMEGRHLSTVSKIVEEELAAGN